MISTLIATAQLFCVCLKIRILFAANWIAKIMND